MHFDKTDQKSLSISHNVEDKRYAMKIIKEPGDIPDPCTLDADTTAEWIRNGDTEEAEELAARLAATLYSLAEAMSQRLTYTHDASGNLQTVLTDVAVMMTNPELRLVADALLSKPGGQITTSGKKRFAKLLIPGTPKKNRLFTMRWLAAMAQLNNIKRTREGNEEWFVEWVNQLIDSNNKNFYNRDFDKFRPAIPRKKITMSTLREAIENQDKYLK